MEPWVATLLALLGGGFLAGLAAWVGAPGTIYRDLREQLKWERENRQRADLESASMRAELAVVTAQMLEVRARSGRLERAADAITKHASLGDVLDKLVCCLVFTAVEDGGTIVWCNLAFANALQRQREEVIDMGWRRLVHPDDLRATQAAEGSAWRSPVSEFVNRYQRADGLYVQFRWHSTQYHGGISVSVIRDEGLVG